MKKRLLILIILILVVSGCLNQETSKEEILDDTSEDVQNSINNHTEEILEELNYTILEESQVNESIEEAQPEIETELELIYPKLTYPNAYNGPLYATSEQVGNNAPTEQYWENLDRNGVNYLIAFFQIYGEPSEDILMSSRNLGYVLDWVEKYPYRVIPFFNPGLGGDDVESLVGDELTSMYSGTLQASKNIVGDDFIKGFGELETHMWDMRHDDPKFMQMVSLADDNKLFVMFHPVPEKINDVTTIIETYPDTTFFIHMYHEDLSSVREELIDIMETHDNLYFSIDVAHILHHNGHDILYTYNEENKDNAKNRFISTFDSDYQDMLDRAVETYKPLVDAVPDKVMWGTETGPLFNWEPEVYDRMIKISRLFIGELDTGHQEAVGYKNALRLFGEGVKLDLEIDVIDASSWPICTSSQRDRREEECETTDYIVEVEACRELLLVQQECIEEIEESIEEIEESIDAEGEEDTGDVDENDGFCVPFDGEEEECLSHSDKCEWNSIEGGICENKT